MLYKYKQVFLCWIHFALFKTKISFSTYLFSVTSVHLSVFSSSQSLVSSFVSLFPSHLRSHSLHSFYFLPLYYASHYHSPPSALSFISQSPALDNTSFSDLTQCSELKGVEFSLSLSFSMSLFISHPPCLLSWKPALVTSKLLWCRVRVCVCLLIHDPQILLVSPFCCQVLNQTWESTSKENLHLCPYTALEPRVNHRPFFICQSFLSVITHKYRFACFCHSHSWRSPWAAAALKFCE